MLRVGIDIGGTFTDLVALEDATGGAGAGATGGAGAGATGFAGAGATGFAGAGATGFAGAGMRVLTRKVPSTPRDYGDGIVAGLAALLAEAGHAGSGISEILHATTIGSNTILEGKGARTALLTSAGFRDVLEIRDLRMPRLYDLHWTKPPPLVERRLRLEVAGRIRPDGSEAVPLDRDGLDAAVARMAADGVRSVAICLLHAYANPAHERDCAAAIRAALPDVALSVSHEILPEIKEYPRTSTTVVNAYVQPVVRAYLTALSARLRAMGVAAPLRLMQSNGGMASAEYARDVPAHIVESGPAAGVVGAAALARHLGEARIITFDMGGTTAKAGLVENGEVLRTDAMEVGGGTMAGSRLLVGAGYMLKLPAIDLAEVGAGGGSICRLDAAGAPKAGPDSAGADPGPVCYGTGGTEPTITDCNLVLGYLDPAGLAGGALPLDLEAARAAVASRLAGPLGTGVEQAASGMLRLAAATMMRAVRAVSVERGRDAREFTLLAFGGNGPLFGAMLAAELGMRRVVVPPLPGLFSAFGLLVAETEHHASRSLRLRLGEGPADPALAGRLGAALDALAAEGAARLREDGFPPERQALRRGAQARYAGQSSEIPVTLPDGDAAAVLAALPTLFAEAHERTYGFRAPPEEPVELISVEVVARGLPDRPRLPGRLPPAGTGQVRRRRAWFGAWQEIEVLDRAALRSEPRPGPLIVQEYDGTCLVPPGWAAALDGFGNIVVTPAV